MLPSVTPINYKVPQLTIKAVCSALASCRLIEGETEVIMLDDASGDDSMDHLCTALGGEPRVRLLESLMNGGFARGSNQTVAEAGGEHLLLLNPDTLVGESMLSYCSASLRTHPKAGAIGPRLINQSEVMHPESKWGVPTLWHGFCRLTRLYRLVPCSAWFNDHYQGHLPSDEVQQVPVLTDAFPMMRRALYQAVGGPDERYFMYGEDIDLCYTIERAGYHSYRLPMPVLHYKGESEQVADRIRYEENFCGVMRPLYLKHQGRSWWSRRVTMPLALTAINLQRCPVRCRRKVEASLPPSHTVSLTLAKLVTDVDTFPEEIHLQLSLAGASYDSLLETMECCATRRYLFIVNA